VIYIYKDVGVSRNSFEQTQKCFETMASRKETLNYSVTALSAAAIKIGAWKNDARCLILPGGADIPYGAALNGLGNQMIRNYVENGGIYIGICAGAYYGARRIEFEKNSPTAIVADRELGFFPGTVKGPHWANYVAGHHAGSRAVRTYCGEKWQTPPWDTYINGGGCFVTDASCTDSITPVAWDASGNLMMVMMSIGKGRVFLSAAHWEYDPQNLVPCCGAHKSKGCWQDADYTAWMDSNAIRLNFVQTILLDLFSTP